MFRKLKRRVERKTDYKQRLGLLKSGKPRIIVRKSLYGIKSQVIEYSPSGDRVLASAMTKDIRKFGWLGGFDLPAAYLTGYLLGKRAKEKGISEAVLDIGITLSTKGNRIYAFAKGCIDAGIKMPLGDGIVPEADRISGRHIENYAKLLKQKDAKLYESRFSSYLKSGIKPEEISSHFEAVKKSIGSKPAEKK